MSEPSKGMFVTVDENAKQMLADRAKAEQPDKTGGGKGGKKIPSTWAKIEPDTEMVARILPPWSTEGIYAYTPYLQVNQHWDVGPNGDRVLCPQNTPHATEKRCYVCEQCKLLFATGNPGDEKRARRMYAGRNFIYQIIERGDEFWMDGDDKIEDHPELVGKPKIKFMRLPYSAHRQVTDILADPDWGSVTCHLNGRDLKVKRRGSGINTEYGVVAKPNTSPMFSDETKTAEAADLMNNMEEHPFFRPPTYDETMGKYIGEEVAKSTSLPTHTASHSLPPSSGGGDYAKWVADAGAGQPLDRNQLAQHMKWDVAQIPPCYADEPNHQDSDCQRCPAKQHCAPQYAATKGNGSFSMKEPAPAAPPMGGKSGYGASPAPLFGKGGEVPIPPAPDDDDIPF